MSKQSSIKKEYTVWCHWALSDINQRPLGHAGHKQSRRHSEVEFIDHIETLGWSYRYKDYWLCPACKEAADDE